MNPSTFRIVALDAAKFSSLFGRSDDELRAIGALRMTVDEKPGVPCRVSLEDAEVGEGVLLLPYVHHDVKSPYRGSGPIFVRRGVATAMPRPGEVPAMLRHRLLSIRAYDDAGMLQGSDVLQGHDLERTILRFFQDDRVRYLHVHNAKPGCFNCSVVRA